MITIRDVAKSAGVSTSTVSRVVCNNGFVSQKTRERVQHAIQDLGYRPNNLAQGLKNKRSNVIGVVVPDLSSPYFASMLKGVEEVVENANMNMIVCSGHMNRTSEIKAIGSLLDHRCDALILNVEDTVSTSEEKLAKLVPARVPVVLLGLYAQRYSESSICLDNEFGGFLATNYLIRQGHRDIIHLIGPMTYSDSRARLSGYQRALKQAGLPYRQNYVIEGEDYTEEFGYRTTKELLEHHVRFSAIFAGDDDIACGVLEALRDKEINVPETVLLVGFDDMFYSRLMHPKLTTIRQPALEMGKSAGALAIRLISGRSAEDIQKKFLPELVIRSSVAQIL